VRDINIQRRMSALCQKQTFNRLLHMILPRKVPEFVEHHP
jgi:hypothetical protein